MTVTKEPQGNGNDHYMQGYEEGVRDTKEFWVKKNQRMLSIVHKTIKSLSHKK